MRELVLLLLLLSLISCLTSSDKLLGEWRLVSRFYSATYQIIEDGKELKALVLYYNDGTTKYHYSEGEEYYLFTGLKEKNGVYVDGVSSATKVDEKVASKPNLSIKRIGLDTLEVTTYVREKPKKEIWVRNIEMKNTK